MWYNEEGKAQLCHKGELAEDSGQRMIQLLWKYWQNTQRVIKHYNGNMNTEYWIFTSYFKKILLINFIHKLPLHKVVELIVLVIFS